MLPVLYSAWSAPRLDGGDSGCRSTEVCEGVSGAVLLAARIDTALWRPSNRLDTRRLQKISVGEAIQIDTRSVFVDRYRDLRPVEGAREWLLALAERLREPWLEEKGTREAQWSGVGVEYEILP